MGLHTIVGARKYFPSATNVKQIDDEGQEKYYPTSVHKNIFIFKVHTRLRNGVFLFFFSVLISDYRYSLWSIQTGQGSVFSGFTVSSYTIIIMWNFLFSICLKKLSYCYHTVPILSLPKKQNKTKKQ